MRIRINFGDNNKVEPDTIACLFEQIFKDALDLGMFEDGTINVDLIFFDKDNEEVSMGTEQKDGSFKYTNYMLSNYPNEAFGEPELLVVDGETEKEEVYGHIYNRALSELL